MATPINDFVMSYRQSSAVRFHMPGHKGIAAHGLEAFDITEIQGADYLYDPSGIIARSEQQTARAFGCGKTLYSTEGSSQCIKTMLGIIKQNSVSDRVTVLAARNVHKAFIDACILLDLDIRWIYPQQSSDSICCAKIDLKQLEEALRKEKVDCCYVTSPDYLGNIADIKAISEICKAFGVALLVDNAHGAYTAFLKNNIHPIALGADMCCDSAHKTLPCYTGGAYLHISSNAPESYAICAKNVMSMFGSTSPSYLILQSLDLCSDLLASGKFATQLERSVKMVHDCKQSIKKLGWALFGDEEMKITLCAAQCGYTGTELAQMLRAQGIEPEYCDKRFLVLMAGVSNTQQDFDRLVWALERIKPQKPLKIDPVPIVPAVQKMSVRQAALQAYSTVSVDRAVGRICAISVTSCQPSVPVVVSGELITQDVVKILKRYSISFVNVL